MIYSIECIPHYIYDKLSGKSKYIIQLNKQNIRIPKTWIIPLEKIIDFEQMGALKKIKKYEDIIEIMGFQKLDQLLSEFEKLVANNPSIRFCVRSSSFDEDGLDKSNAGVYDSFVNIRSGTDLLDKLILVLCSYFSQTIDESLNFTFLETSSVVIQEFIVSIKSGVIYKTKDEFLIECCYGLPQGIVDSLVVPDVVRITKNNEIEYKTSIDRKSIQPVLNRSYPKLGDHINLIDGNFGEVKKIDELNYLVLVEMDTSKIDNKMILEDSYLLELSSFVEKNIQIPLGLDKLDIEFGIDRNNKLYIFQVRPITTVVDLNLISTDNKLLSVCPGKIRANLINYKENYSKEKYNGMIVAIDQIDGAAFYKLKNCSGLIINTGSYLSHSSILARELMKPTIGLKNQFIEFDENNIYEINANYGQLKITKFGLN